MSQLVPSVLPLDKGLDLQTAKIIAPPGSVLDTLNYEQVDFQGQKRIEGYTRYDGSVLSAIDEYYVLTLESAFDIAVGDILMKDGVVFGVVGQIDGDDIYYLQTNSAVSTIAGTAVTSMVPGTGSTTDYTVATNTPGTQHAESATAHYDILLSLMTAIRNRVEWLPGAIAGLHWFQDRLYCVADIAYFKIDSESQIFPNDVLEIDGVDMNVLDVLPGGGGQIVLVQTTRDEFDGAEVYRNAVLMGTASDIIYPDSIDQYATFFESRNEQQVYVEDGGSNMDFGWRAKHLGWVVAYEDGITLYGTLAALNQNRQNVGIEGPTSTTGTSGSPAVLNQKIALTNGPAQVNGWKSSDTPTNYVLDATDVQLVDLKYTYADAFVSWTADSAVVSTPGSDMNGLVEYSPTNTIRFTALP